MVYPHIFLAIDNCFASKRWTAPYEWARIVRDLGVANVEASADNECDPLYAGPAFLADWLGDVRVAERQTGVRVANFYSGHGTYATLGLGHPDWRVRRRMLDHWLKMMVRNAGYLRAGLGFYCHAFPESVMQQPDLYYAALGDLYSALAEVARHAAACGVQPVALEQMYTPNQVPWTINGTEELMREVLARAGSPLYITIDTGHQTGQQRFKRPERDQIMNAVQCGRMQAAVPRLSLGPAAAYRQLQDIVVRPQAEEETLISRLEEEIDRYPYLFASPEDGDLYAWLERLGAYSPIVHLQQTAGDCSAHLPFTPENNAAGIVRPERVLQSLAAAHAREPVAGLPPRCSKIYLTLEIFSAPVDTPAEIIDRLRASVAYWRRYVPQDGLPLDRLLALDPASGAE